MHEGTEQRFANARWVGCSKLFGERRVERLVGRARTTARPTRRDATVRRLTASDRSTLTAGSEWRGGRAAREVRACVRPDNKAGLARKGRCGGGCVQRRHAGARQAGGRRRC